MPKNSNIRKILVIGSGPIIIGQAAEFDYSGSQACLSLREEGYQVILINSNPATIMTDKEIADKVFIEPITLPYVSKIVREERPDAILPTLGGQTGLNMAKQLADSGILDELQIRLLGSDLNSIETAEDRQNFKDLMVKLDEPVPESKTIDNVQAGLDFADEIGYPIVVRPAYTLGGAGGGFAHDRDELTSIISEGLRLSPITQVLVEHSIAGYKEIEFEVMRDAIDNTMIVAALENIDPVGIHTGDSIVTAPTQTLSDKEYQMLRDVSLKIIRALNIEGGCNIQFALDENSMQYYIIEVNPRVSRSSALASKATGYPIAKISAKIAVGMHLDEIKNPITEKSWAEFEPMLDYVVTKIPRWPFDKFTNSDRHLGTQMKATGEVMAIGRNVEESLLKAIRSLDIDNDYLTGARYQTIATKDLFNQLIPAQDDRLFVILELIRRGVTIEQINEKTQINLFYLDKFLHIVEIENQLKDLDPEMIEEAKQNGFTDQMIADYSKRSVEQINNIREDHQIKPVYKMVDTAAGEFESKTPYYYSTYEKVNESKVSKKPSVLILGSGPIRIGQGVEFDYSTVHCIKGIQRAGYEAIVINSNPETVSTDFSVADKLYFEPLDIEEVMNVIDLERPLGVIVQFGGQTAINLVESLDKRGVNILGTKVEDINESEDRELFGQAIDELGLIQPQGQTATNSEEALNLANRLGYPVLIRPSYVIGGKAMEIVNSDDDLKEYMQKAVKVSNQHPVLIDSYLAGTEAELDLISDGENVVIPGILEHIERSGVHSGDSMAAYPAQNLSDSVKKRMESAAIKLARRLNIVGLMNVQFIVHNDRVYVIEVNPRSSRTVPFMSKVTDIPMAQVATKVILGKSLSEQGYSNGLAEEPNKISVKAPVFSFQKLPMVNSTLGPEMKSTGEVMGTADTYVEALKKAFVGAGITIPQFKNVFFTVAKNDQVPSLALAKRFVSLGFKIYGTANTANYFNAHQVPAEQFRSDWNKHLAKDVQVMVNTDSSIDQEAELKGKLRSLAIENNVPLFTALDTVDAFLKVLEAEK